MKYSFDYCFNERSCLCKKCKQERSELKRTNTKTYKIRVAKKVIRDALRECNVKLCKVCLVPKKRYIVATRSSGHAIYTNDKKQMWNGKTCPECHLEAKRVRLENRLRRPKKDPKPKPPLMVRLCITCQKEFNPRGRQKCCSKKCISPRVYKPKPKIKREPKIYERVCDHCNIQFTSNSVFTKFCKPSHHPSSKRTRKHRKYVESYKQSISKFFKKEIIKLYEQRPEGFELDHIIPLKHPDVCGLHVPWNMQYLPREINGLKSNLWDGTYDNNGWIFEKIKKNK